MNIYVALENDNNFVTNYEKYKLFLNIVKYNYI